MRAYIGHEPLGDLLLEQAGCDVADPGAAVDWLRRRCSDWREGVVDA